MGIVESSLGEERRGRESHVPVGRCHGAWRRRVGPCARRYDEISGSLGSLSKGGKIDVEEAKRILAKDAADQNKAAGKLQAIQRGNSRRKEDAGGGGGGTIEEVFANFCKIYRQEQMTNTIFAKFCKDTKGIIDKKKFAVPQIDMVLSRVERGRRSIGSRFERFPRPMLDRVSLERHYHDRAFPFRSGAKPPGKTRRSAATSS